MSTVKPASPARRRRIADNLRRAASTYDAIRKTMAYNLRSPSISAALEIAEAEVDRAATRYLEAHGRGS